MNKLFFFLSILLFSFLSHAQTGNKLNTRFGFAHFDDMDGKVFGLSYTKKINFYFDLSADLSYAHTSDFPNNFSTQNMVNTSFWYTKSTIFDLSILPSLVFIRTERHYFSFFVGIGHVAINTSDFTRTIIDIQNQQIDTIVTNVEERSTFSRTLGVFYNYRLFNNYLIGLDIRMIRPLREKSTFFGLDNYRSVSFVISRSF